MAVAQKKKTKKKSFSFQSKNLCNLLGKLHQKVVFHIVGAFKSSRFTAVFKIHASGE